MVKDLPVPVLLGRDWLGFDHLLVATIHPASQNRSCQNANQSCRPPTTREMVSHKIRPLTCILITSNRSLKGACLDGNSERMIGYKIVGHRLERWKGNAEALVGSAEVQD